MHHSANLNINFVSYDVLLPHPQLPFSYCKACCRCFRIITGLPFHMVVEFGFPLFVSLCYSLRKGIKVAWLACYLWKLAFSGIIRDKLGRFTKAWWMKSAVLEEQTSRFLSCICICHHWVLTRSSGTAANSFHLLSLAAYGTGSSQLSCRMLILSGAYREVLVRALCTWIWLCLPCSIIEYYTQ